MSNNTVDYASEDIYRFLYKDIRLDDPPVEIHDFSSSLTSMENSHALICWQFNGEQILVYFGMYFALSILTYRYPKSHQISSNIVSNASCWIYLLSNNVDRLISYYWYDLILMILHGDHLMILHHVFTLYGIMHCPSYVDYSKIMLMLRIIKASDILIHHYKIIDGFNPQGVRYLLAKIHQFIAVLYTCISWFLLRIIAVIYLFPFMSVKANVLIPVFLMLQIVWLWKLTKTLKHILNDIYYWKNRQKR